MRQLDAASAIAATPEMPVRKSALKTASFDVGDVAVVEAVAVGPRLLGRAVAVVRSLDVHDDEDGEEEEEDADGQDGAGHDGKRGGIFSIRRRLRHRLDLVRVDERLHSVVLLIRVIKIEL